MSNDQPSNEDILAAIRASGYLMEQEIATMIESLGFHVETNRAFEDFEESKSREIDVWGFRTFLRNEETKFQVTAELICECKNNSNPYVFITRPKNKKDKTQPAPREYLFPIQEYHRIRGRQPDGSPQGWTRVPAFQHLNLAPHHYYYSQDSKAVQFCTIARKGKSWEANHGGIYDAIFYPLVKSLLSRQLAIRGLHKDNGKDLIFDDWKHISLFFPMVILNGDIYCVDSTAEDPQPIKTQHVTLTRELQAKSIKGKFIVDFVTLKGLKEFIELNINPFIEHIASATESSPNIFMTKEFESTA
jgi:hypothetical protein